MKIISGRYYGAPLQSAKGATTRPTAQRTREALFSLLESAAWCELAGARVIDLFAGSGALGLEALSRGAEFCLFVEQNKQAAASIHNNIAAVEAEEATQILRRDATKLGKRPTSFAPFNLVFIDPPYDKGLAARAVASLVKGEWLAAGAVLVLEDDKRAPVPNLTEFILQDERVYSDTRLNFYTAPAR